MNLFENLAQLFCTDLRHAFLLQDEQNNQSFGNEWLRNMCLVKRKSRIRNVMIRKKGKLVE